MEEQVPNSEEQEGKDVAADQHTPDADDEDESTEDKDLLALNESTRTVLYESDSSADDLYQKIKKQSNTPSTSTPKKHKLSKKSKIGSPKKRKFDDGAGQRSPTKSPKKRRSMMPAGVEDVISQSVATFGPVVFSPNPNGSEQTGQPMVLYAVPYNPAVHSATPISQPLAFGWNRVVPPTQTVQDPVVEKKPKKVNILKL
jgi:hypothetical protein